MDFIEVNVAPDNYDPAMLAAKYGVSLTVAQGMSNTLKRERVFRSSDGVYQVKLSPVFAGAFPGGVPVPMAHLAVARVDQQPIRAWTDMQAIKNSFVGPKCFAVEVYPSEDRLVDCGNEYHLWAVLDPELQPTFGYVERMVRS